MKTYLLYGQGRIEIEVPEWARILEIKDIPPISDPVTAIKDALNRPIDTPPLRELAKGRNDACIVISDITRPTPNGTILPPLLEEVESSGINREKIKILIATGMHRPNEGKELEYLVGKEIMEKYTIINHSCEKREDLRTIDSIEGVPIEINRHYLEADLKILTGLIEPHFYAGYSGGRKSILPGISSFETMKFMHSFEMIDHPNVRNCILDNNPFHEYGLRVAEKAGVDFILNVVINKARKVAGVFAGHFNKAHLEGCKLVEKHAVQYLPREADIVITSGGGFPLDATFYQMSKPLICARDILKRQGIIILACECREGLGGPEFSSVLKSISRPGEFFNIYSKPENFLKDQWCAQNIFQALDHADRIFVYSSGLKNTALRPEAIVKIDNIQSTIDSHVREGMEVVVVPEGPYVVGKIEDQH